MTADDRLNQLEPLLAETITILDRHTNQLKQLNNISGQLTGSVGQLTGSVGQLTGSVGQLSTAMVQQSDNITFLLREQMEMKADIADLKTGQAETNGKLDQLLQLLQKPGN